MTDVTYGRIGREQIWASWKFPVDPLLATFPPQPSPAVLREWSLNHDGPCPGTAPWIAEVCGVTRETVNRWRTGAMPTVPWWTADRIATRLRVHPAAIWPEWWHIEPSKAAA